VAVAVVRLAEERLADGDVAAAEGGGGTGHVEEPDAVGLLGDVVEKLALAGLEAVDPEAEGAVVVLAEVLDIADFKPGSLGGAHHFKERDEFAVGEDIAVNEGAGADRRGGGADDAVVEEDSAGFEEPVGDAEVGGQVFEPDVLDHADAGDLVEGGVEMVAVAVVAEFDGAG